MKIIPLDLPKMEIRVMLCWPGNGNAQVGSAKGVYMASGVPNKAVLYKSLMSGGNFNELWTAGLNASARGMYTHFAMLHADIEPLMEDVKICPKCEGKGCANCHEIGKVATMLPRWVDVLTDELTARDADLISVPIAIKDGRGLTSSGIGNCEEEHWWFPHRRFAVRELANTGEKDAQDKPLQGKLPETFGYEEACEALPDMRRPADGCGYLLHNNGMWVADLRKPVWHTPLPDGDAPVFFEFKEKVYWDEEKKGWTRIQESEDWNFSRKLHIAGAKTCITSKVKTWHWDGGTQYANYGDWGMWDCDYAAKPRWTKELAAAL